MRALVEHRTGTVSGVADGDATGSDAEGDVAEGDAARSVTAADDGAGNGTRDEGAVTGGEVGIAGDDAAGDGTADGATAHIRTAVDHPADGASRDGDTGDDGARDGDAAMGDLIDEPPAVVGLGPAGTEVVQDAPEPSPVQLRVDFGAHLEANYQRLVAQLFAITLDPGEAHDVVQDAYSRAWRNWAEIGGSPDPSAWIRCVAVRSTTRSWRRVLARFGIGQRRPVGDGAGPRTGALLTALGRLSPAERRAVVLIHMAGVPLGEVAAIEQVSPGTVHARLARSRHVVTEDMADVSPAVLGLPMDNAYAGHGYDEGDYR